MTDNIYFGKVYGGLIGAAIGDAMGGPVEMWAPADIVRAYGWISDMLPYTMEPNPTYVWQERAPPGTYTDDTRLKLLVAELTAERGSSLSARDLAETFIAGYDAAEAGSLEKEWYTEWAAVGKAYLSDLADTRSVGLHSFYGGEMVGGGLIAVLPIGFMFPDDAEQAYHAAYDLSFFDLGYARDATALATAFVSRAMAQQAAVESILDAAGFDPHGLGKRHIFGRVCGRYVEEALKTARNAKSRENLVEALHQSVLRATPCDPVEMLAFIVAILKWTRGDPAEAIPLAVNAGRDNDSVAGVVGMIAGTLHGIDAFPDRWVQTVEEVNPIPDIRELAGNLCDAIPARSSTTPA